MQLVLPGLGLLLLLSTCPRAEAQDAGVQLRLRPGCRLLCSQEGCTSTCRVGASAQTDRSGPGQRAGPMDVSDPTEVREQRHHLARTQSGSSGALLPWSSSRPAQTRNQIQAQTLRGDHVYTQHSGFKYCFREVKDGQCASPLPGLRTREMCCRGIGQAWGTSDCVPCPQSGQNSSCQSGFQQVNGTKCVDVNECLKPGLCENGVCVNTMGSYSCVCRPGFILDASHGLCISRSVISEEKGQCYRVLSPGTEHCSLPILKNITQQICCCSRVGKAWGPDCRRCPYFGSEAFKQACPAGPGYQYSASTLLFNQRTSQPLGGRGASKVPPRDHHSQDSGFSVPEGGSTGVSKISTSVSSTSVKPPLAPGAQPNALSPGTLQIGGRTASDTKPSRTSAQQSRPSQTLPVKSIQVAQTSQHGRQDSSQWDLPRHRRPSPSPPPQRIPVPSSPSQKSPGPSPPLQKRPGLSMPSQRRPVPSPPPQKRPVPSPPPQKRPGLSMPSQRRPVPSPPPQKRPAPNPPPLRRTVPSPDPEWPPTLPPRVPMRSVCENRPDACGPGHCVEQPRGRYTCVCNQGYEPNFHRTFCHDRDECLQSPCGDAYCTNTPGSFRCVCRLGYRLNNATCTDIDECLDPLRCPGQECLNSPGSYRCVSCQRGFQLLDRLCTDVNECEDAGSCPGQQCVNSEGSFRCVDCRHGYQAVKGVCTDIDECHLSDHCSPGGKCVNVPGSYTCMCADGFTHSVDRSACLANLLPESEPSATPTGEPLPSAWPGEVRECYYNLAEQGTCNLLATNTTQQECCCTVGEGWGLGCQYQTCPASHSVQFQLLCPSGRGYVTGSSEAFSYTDVDECKRFHPEVCKNGICVNNIPGYNCYCPSGYVYDGTLLECVDHDECEEESCVGGACVNTVGSYYCSCPTPLSLDDTQRTCVNTSHLSLDESVSLCWLHVTADLVCQSPLLSGQVSFSDCCCLYGAGWGMECALCPAPDSDEYGALCSSVLPPSLPEGLPDLPRQGPDAGPGAGRSGRFRGRTIGAHRSDDRPSFPRAEFRSYPDYGDPLPRPPSFTRHQDPRAERPYWALAPPPLITEDYAETRSSVYDRRTGTQRRIYDGRAEASAADDCGILFGCENGRCVRVSEGYTCDCHYGYQLDLTFMTCRDINECDDIASMDFPCVNSRCVNTEGSFRCVCRRGYVLSHRPNHCVAA